MRPGTELRRAERAANLFSGLTENPYVRAVGLYLAVQLLGVLVLAVLSGWHDYDLLTRLTAWDGQWYLRLAQHGYDGITGLRDADGQFFAAAPLAFFPLYPALIAIGAALPGVGVVGGALGVSVLAGCLAACGLVRLARAVDPRSAVGLLLVALLAGAPMAITFSMAYTEAVFVALAVWALVGVLERRWLLAGAACLCAGLTRPTAAVLIGVVGIAALVAVWQGRDRLRALACALLCPLGMLGYLGYVGVRTGSATGWMEIEQRGWNTGFDFGAASVRLFARTLATGSSVMHVGVVVLALAAVALTFVCAKNRLPWPLVGYAAGVLVLVLGSASLAAAKARFLLPAEFVLLLPVAIGLANRRAGTRVGAVAALTALGVWYGAYSLTGWHYAI